MKENKIRLNSAKSQFSVNENSFMKLELNRDSNILPIGDIENTINVGEQFNKERQTSPYYRLTGTFNTLFNNVLFNNSTDNSWTTFNSAKFRDVSFPSNANLLSELDSDEGDLTYSESVDKHLKEDNGWFGYLDPDPNNVTLCTFIDMDPNRDKFSMTPKNKVKNWELTVTYPVKFNDSQGDKSNPLINGGIQIIDVEENNIGGRNVLTFTTPIKHGLSQGETVKLKNLSSNNGTYTVIRVGKDNGDFKEYSFSVEIEGLVDIITPNGTPARMVRMVGSRESIYYLRVFKKITVRDGNLIENDDYEIFPLAFSKTIYEDNVPKFVINEDIDISNLKDNLGRPLSELYITIIKTSSDGVFTNIKSGVKMPFDDKISNDKSIPDINRITNDDLNSHIPLDDNVNIQQNEFYGDVVEFNVLEQRETILGEVYHRFNTSNREINSTLINVDFEKPSNSYELGERYEGYMYKAHHKIQIRNFSNYIEQGTFNTINKPIYSDNLNDGRFIWRDLLDIGVNDGQNETIDYPFLNGAHYINSSFTLALERQDPFGFYGLQHTPYPNDNVGDRLNDNFITKRSEDVC